MPAKTPIYLKTAHKKGKKFRLRDVLSPDMISPPLGDFRHTIHIGREGQRDVFGDISFLQGNYELLPGAPEEAARGPTLPGHDFFRANSTSDSALPETPSPVLKNAISLPSIGGSQALMLPLLSPGTFHTRQETLGLARLGCAPSARPQAPPPGQAADVSWASSGSASQSSQGRDSHSSSLSEQYPDWPAEDMFDPPPPLPCPLSPGKAPSQTSLSDLTGSLLSLQLDLGPSLLDEVLNVMEKNK